MNDVMGMETAGAAICGGRSFIVFLQTSQLPFLMNILCLTWMESISAEKTLEPSFDSKAAKGRPTTSDLRLSESIARPD